MKYKIFVFLFLIGITFTACEGDLEPKIYDRIAPSNFYKTSNDLKVAVTAIYWELKNNGWDPYMVSDNSRFVMNEVGTDEFTMRWDPAGFKSYNWVIGDNYVYGFYGKIMPAVTKATYVIERIKDCPVEEQIKDKYIAELRCLRAYYIADLYMLYGPLPVIITKDEAFYPSSENRPSRPIKESILNFVETELTECAADLPIAQTDWGRCTRGAALAKLLKLYLYEKQWDKAVEVTTEIMTLGYALQTTYSDIFTVANEQNKEIIFAIPCVPLSAYGLLWFSNASPPDYKSPIGINYTAWNGWRIPWTFYDSFEPGDKRKLLIKATYTNKSNITVDLRADGDIGALALKYGEDASNPGQWAGNDYIQFRYADILLCRAEALNEVNAAPTQEMIDLINLVRKRAFDNYDTSARKLTLAKYPTKELLRLRILKERSWELWCEGVRREDLLRQGKYIEVALASGATSASEKNLLFPIPTAALIENPNLGNNPLY